MKMKILFLMMLLIGAVLTAGAAYAGEGEAVKVSQCIAGEILERNAALGMRATRQYEVRAAGAVQTGDLAPSGCLTGQVMKKSAASG